MSGSVFPSNVVVIGAGTMGNGIAQVFAFYGFDVCMADISDDALQKGLATIDKSLDRIISKGNLTQDQKAAVLSRIQTSTDIPQAAAKAHLIVEAATENIDLKLKIFKSLSDSCSVDTILASNTSSISITKIASVVTNPSRVIGMHFMNPVPVMKLVEIIRGYNTSNAVAQTITQVSEKLDKIPVVANDYPGFVANRILMPMINEAIEALWQGVAGVKEIDSIMKLGMAHPMGPLQLADFIGLDVCLAILEVLHNGLGNPKYAPCPLLVNMVAAGKKGAKTGEGFYTYTPGSKDLIVSPYFQARS